MRTPLPPLRDDLRFSNTTGILKKKNYVVYWCKLEQETMHPLLKKILDPPLFNFVQTLYKAIFSCLDEMRKKTRSAKLHFRFYLLPSNQVPK